MIANSILAAGALVSLVAAVPMAQPPYAKRDIVWETHTEVALTTIPVTVTHWLEPGETPPTVNKQHYGHGHGGHGGYGGHGKPPAQQPEPTEPAVSAAAPSSPAAPTPAPSSPESAPPAPAPSSYEQPTTQQAPPPAPTTTQAPPPAPTTTQAPAPEPTTTQAAPPAYTPEPQPSPEPSQPSDGGSSSGGSNGLSGMAAPGVSHTGEITYYTPGLGACGFSSTGSEDVVAIAEAFYDQYNVGGNPNNNPLCKKMISITGPDGSTSQAQVVDRCPGCATTDLDLSPSLFKKFAPLAEGRVSGMEWSFV